MKRRAWLLAVLVLLALVARPAGAQDLARTEPEAVRELVERHAPVVIVKAQEGPCDDDGEPYAPADVDAVLGNSQVVLRQLGPGDPVVRVGPTAADLFGLGEGFHLDFPGSALDPGCLYEADHDRFVAPLGPTVYAHVVIDPDEPDRLALQYWFWWYYNDWNNKHESDWEFIQILFEASSVEEALQTEPLSVGYAQHEGGQRADWDGGLLERDGDRPVVYPSAGSHASYFGSAVYVGRSGSEGFGCDDTTGPSERLDPRVVVLPDAVDDPQDTAAWLAFEGRWGERQSGPFNGPTGPAAKERWTEPVAWHDDLRTTSVVIPAGASVGASVVGLFCDVVEAGSGTLITFRTSPLQLLIALAVAIVVVRWLVRRTDWSVVPTSPLRRRRRAGQLLRASLRRYRELIRTVAPVGLVYAPAIALAALLGGLLGALPLIRDIVGLAGQDSGTSLVLALAAGGIPQVIALTIVNGAVSAQLDAADEGERMSTIESLRIVARHAGPLAGGLLRAIVVVGLLLLSVVGAPIAVWLTVRYQFLAQCVVLEGRSGGAALARSGTLVQRRWFRTAILVLAFQGLLVVAASLLGVLLLVVSNGVPLWLFSAIVAVGWALLVPVIATAQSLLWGDLVAADAEESTEEPDAGESTDDLDAEPVAGS